LRDTQYRSRNCGFDDQAKHPIEIKDPI